MLRQLNIWKIQDDQLITLQSAAIAAHEVIDHYLKKALNSRHSCVAMLCDPRYKLNILRYLYAAEGGERSSVYTRAKAHFQSVFSSYQRRAIGLAEWDRQQAENVAIDTHSSQSPTLEDRNAWRDDPFHGFHDFIAAEQENQLPMPAGSNTEVERWFREPCLPRKSSPEELKAYMQSKVYDFPIVTQIARDFTAIPATSAPSERVFSQAGNLVSKKKTRINSANIRYLLCLRAWGLLAEEDDDDNDDTEEEGVLVMDEENRMVRRQEV
jgi:hypothetical protein